MSIITGIELATEVQAADGNSQASNWWCFLPFLEISVQLRQFETRSYHVITHTNITTTKKTVQNNTLFLKEYHCSTDLTSLTRYICYWGVCHNVEPVRCFKNLHMGSSCQRAVSAQSWNAWLLPWCFSWLFLLVKCSVFCKTPRLA